MEIERQYVSCKDVIELVDTMYVDNYNDSPDEFYYYHTFPMLRPHNQSLKNLTGGLTDYRKQVRYTVKVSTLLLCCFITITQPE